MDDLDTAAPFSAPPDPLEQPTQLDIETAIAETPPSDAELEAALAEAVQAKAVLEEVAAPILEAEAGVAESRAAVEAAREAAAEIERVQVVETERERLAEEADEKRQVETRHFAEWAIAQDAAFASKNPDAATPEVRHGVIAMLRQEGISDEALQAAWTGLTGVNIRSAAMQQVILDAYRWRTRQAPVEQPRSVERPRHEYRPRVAVDDGESSLTPRAAARLLVANRRNA
jgi:hypothetical protein